MISAKKIIYLNDDAKILQLLTYKVEVVLTLNTNPLFTSILSNSLFLSKASMNYWNTITRCTVLWKYWSCGTDIMEIRYLHYRIIGISILVVPVFLKQKQRNSLVLDVTSSYNTFNLVISICLYSKRRLNW